MTQDEKLDETIDETFPASDAPANTVETGIGGPATGETGGGVVRDNQEEGQFEIEKDGQLAFLKYERTRNSLILVHTEVPVSLRGHHLGDVLVKAAIEAAHGERLRIVAVCPFVRAYLRKHAQP